MTLLAGSPLARPHRGAADVGPAVKSLLGILLGTWLLSAPLAALAQGATALLAEYSAKAGQAPSSERGQKLFTTNFGRELGYSCSSCHGAVPTRAGKDQVTEKPITPLAPAANAKRFTDRKRVEYMFRMNCIDIVGRECTALEKADVLSWLVSLKP